MPLFSSKPNVVGTSVVLAHPLSIDTGADDGLFLTQMREAHKTGASTALHHGDTAQAFTNVLQNTDATLASHGEPGIINTGRGRFFTGRDDARSITNKNFAAWELLVDSHHERAIQRLMLFGCNVGAGKEGAELVFRLAKKLNATVKAPVGQVWVTPQGKPSVQDNEPFQEASPEMEAPPAPREAVTPSTTPGGLMQHILMFASMSPQTGMKAIHLRLFGEDATEETLTLEGDEASRIVGAISFDRELVFPGPLATFVTGTLSVTYSFRRTREFTLHNDALIQDQARPTVFYAANLRSLIRNR